MSIQDIKEFIKSPFSFWLFNPEAIIEIINENRVKIDKDATTKLDVYKHFYNQN